MEAAMRLRLRRRIDKLKKQLMELSAEVEESLLLSIKALNDRDTDLATKIVDGDVEIDRLEVDLEEACLEILALHHPVAADLRYIIGILKINENLERIGDLSVNIAETTTALAEEDRISIPHEYFTLADSTQEMLNLSLDAFVNMSTDKAFRVLEQDDEVDTMKHRLHGKFEESIKTESKHHRALIHLFLVSRHLERVADQATNIAEDVIYMITGEIVRHGHRID
jgi:phosphate transport system protein